MAGELGRDHDGPMHVWFNLSYASYLTLPRSFIQEMPAEWQQRLRDLLDEMESALDTGEVIHYRVQRVDDRGRYLRDPYSDYRRGPAPPRRAVSDQAEG